MQIRHPEALDDVGGQCPDRVAVGGDTYECGGGQPFDVTRAQADALAARYGVEVADITVGDEPAESGDRDVCEVVKQDGEVCGRTKPCPYHD